jgi:folate-binding protein YgfZ
VSEGDRLARLRAEGGFYKIADIAPVARFSLGGADRLRYLNGQVSNDLRKLPPGQAMQACVLSARGKLDAVIWIWNEPDRLVVECDAELAEPLGMRLERYIVADDAELAPVDMAGMAEIFHVFGPAAAEYNGLKIPRLGVAGIDLMAPPITAGDLSSPGAGDGGPVHGATLLEATPEEVELLRIERALPRWGAELGPDTLPAEAGLDATAVDFHKGCYIGQEVVSRIRSVGHANRALRVFDVVEGRPSAGDEFFLSGESGRAAATATSVHFALSSGLGLCYIRRGTAEGATLESPAGPSRIQLRQPACVQPS